MKRLIFIFLWLSICVSFLYQIRAENHVYQSSVNLWAGVPENLEGYEGYTYNISDLKMRYRIMNGSSNALKQSVKNFENEGWAEPLTGKNYWNTYGATLGKLRVFAQVFEAVSMGVSAGSGVNASRALAGRVHVSKVSAKGLNTIKTTTTGENGKGTYSVYQGLDESGNVRYVGITSRNPILRFTEHLNSGTARSILDYRVVGGARNLTRTQARIWEQHMINKHGLGKNGGLLFNKVNSIAPKYWGQYGINL